MVSSFRPFGAESDSTSVTKPHLYSPSTRESMIFVSVLMMPPPGVQRVRFNALCSCKTEAILKLKPDKNFLFHVKKITREPEPRQTCEMSPPATIGPALPCPGVGRLECRPSPPQYIVRCLPKPGVGRSLRGEYMSCGCPYGGCKCPLSPRGYRTPFAHRRD